MFVKKLWFIALLKDKIVCKKITDVIETLIKDLEA